MRICTSRLTRGNINAQSARIMAPDDIGVLSSFIEERSKLHTLYIKETQRTKRIYLGRGRVTTIPRWRSTLHVGGEEAFLAWPVRQRTL